MTKAGLCFLHRHVTRKRDWRGLQERTAVALILFFLLQTASVGFHSQTMGAMYGKYVYQSTTLDSKKPAFNTTHCKGGIMVCGCFAARGPDRFISVMLETHQTNNRTVSTEVKTPSGMDQSES